MRSFYPAQTNSLNRRTRSAVSLGNKSIVSERTVLNGAGINLEIYNYQPYPHNKPPRFLYLGRIMKEKGMDELFEACLLYTSRCV